MIRWVGVCSISLLLGAAACSSGGGGKAQDTRNDAGATSSGGHTGASEAGAPKTDVHADATTPSATSVSVMVSAAKGGTVSLGTAALDIPAGSLSGDTKVTLEKVTPGADLPDSKTVTGSLYDFGPDGTTFDPPATLALPVEGTASAGQTAVVSWLDEKAGAWVDLDTTVMDGKASAAIAHFTKFVVRFKDSGTAAVDCSFSACGGDIVGSWAVSAACVDDKKDAGTGNPFGPACPQASLNVSLDATGTIDLRSDGTYETALMGTPMITLTVPGSCLVGGMLPVADCAALAKALDKDGGSSTTCTGDKTVGCTCTGSAGKFSGDHSMGTYTVAGDILQTDKQTDSGTAAGDPAPYCVSGNTLKVRTGDGTIIIATKK